MRPSLRAVLVLVLGIAFAGAASADTVTLKDGQTIEGTITEETAGHVVIQVPGAGALKFTKDRVLSVERAAPGTPGGGAGDEVPTIPEPTPEEAALIEEFVNGIGDTRQGGGAGTRRENAVLGLIDLGIVAIPELTEALKDVSSLGHEYRRQNAARALAGVAGADPRLPLYREAVPELIVNLGDGNPFVRKAANDALVAISGKTVGYPPIPDVLPAPPAGGGTGLPPSPDEIAAAKRWQEWWDAESAKLPPTAPPG